MTPQRIHALRPSEVPDGAVWVGPASNWSNPYENAALGLSLYRDHVNDAESRKASYIRNNLHALRGKDLACSCPEGEACHGDILIELANNPLEPHAYALIIPRMREAEYQSFKADIAGRGLIQPITLYQGQILDGIHRDRACAETGQKPRYDLFAGTGEDALRFVISTNIERRHLDESQRAMVAADMEQFRHGGKRSDGTQGQDANLHLDRGAVAELLNVSKRTVAHAAVVRAKGTPELQEAVRGGEIAVSAAAQAADLPERTQQRIVAEAKAGRANVVRTVLKQEQRAAREQKLGGKILALPEKKYGLILVDIPRKHNTWSDNGLDRTPDNHYVVQDFRWALDFGDKINALAADDCILLYWSTAASLIDDIEILTEWGFVALRPRGEDGRILRDDEGFPFVPFGRGTYRSHQVWDKVVPGLARWVVDRHELLLICARGNVVPPAPGTQPPSLFSSRKGEHSSKPLAVAEAIERLWPSVPKIELFGRGAARPGWDAWGNECTPLTDVRGDPERAESDPPARAGGEDAVRIAAPCAGQDADGHLSAAPALIPPAGASVPAGTDLDAGANGASATRALFTAPIEEVFGPVTERSAPLPAKIFQEGNAGSLRRRDEWAGVGDIPEYLRRKLDDAPAEDADAGGDGGAT